MFNVDDVTNLVPAVLLFDESLYGEDLAAFATSGFPAN
jgi:hypothetical protein